MTSADTGPDVILQTSLRISSYEPPTLAYRDGFVVTPSSTPQRATVRISSMSAVSRKIFMRADSSRFGRVDAVYVGMPEATTRRSSAQK